MGICNDAGFSPRVENEPNMMPTVLSMLEAEQGVSIVPCVCGYLHAARGAGGLVLTHGAGG